MTDMISRSDEDLGSTASTSTNAGNDFLLRGRFAVAGYR